MTRVAPNLYTYHTRSGRRYAVRLRVGGRLSQRRGFTTKSQAQRHRDQVKAKLQAVWMAEQARQRATTERIEALLGRYRPVKPTPWKGASERRKRRFRETHSAYTFWKFALKGERVGALSPTLITNLLRARGCMATATYKHYLQWLVTVCNQEVRAGRFRRNPLLGLGRRKEAKAPKYSYSNAQAEALYQQLGPVYSDWVRLALLTSLSRTEFFAMRREHIRWREGLVLVPDPQGGMFQWVLLTEDAMDILGRILARHHGTPWVFPSSQDPQKHISPGPWYARIFKPAKKRANISAMPLWRTLRRTLPPRMAAQGAQDHERAAARQRKDWRAVKRHTHHGQRKIITSSGRLGNDGKRGLQSRKNRSWERYLCR